MIDSKISEISNNSLIKARDATYFEDISFKTKIPNQQFDQPSSSSRTSSFIPTQPEYKLEPRSKRVRKEKDLGDGFFTFLGEGESSMYEEVMSSTDAHF